MKDMRGQQRHGTLVAIRSLFTWAMAEGVLTDNPAKEVKVNGSKHPIVFPLPSESLVKSAATLTIHARLVIALAGIHAARTGAIRALQLDDIDMTNRTLTVGNHTRPLDDLTGDLFAEWLEYRNDQWPDTANQHVMLNRVNALHFGPVSNRFIRRAIADLPFTIDDLRIDRQLEEALTHGPDSVHLMNMFGISEASAYRYSGNARQLLERPFEAQYVGTQRPRQDLNLRPLD